MDSYSVANDGLGPQASHHGPGDTDWQHDTEWLNYMPGAACPGDLEDNPGQRPRAPNCWNAEHIRSLLAFAKQVEGVRPVVSASTPRKTVEQYAAEFKAYREGMFRFEPYPDEAERVQKWMRDAEARLTTAAPAFAPQPLDWPPGLAGEIARYVFAAAPRPVKEVAIIAALGLLAGLCGKAWQIPRSGLNLYIVLIAQSAIGKEAMHTGISEIIAACAKGHPSANNIADFNEYASGPALTKALLANPCFVNVVGEIGRKFKRLAQEDGRDSALGTWRTQITNLYQKSGATSTVGGLGYSNTENNVASVKGAAYSLIGETTPGTFLESLTDSMMDDGFMSRFTVIDYDGPRPDKNLAVANTPPDHVVRLVNNLHSQAKTMIDKGETQLVAHTTFAAVTLETFELLCDENINANKSEGRRQMWNRAHLKVLRIAALLAVADSFGNRVPVITQAHVGWAINLVMRDIAAFTKRLDRGDVGSNDDARATKLTTVIREYLASPVPASYKVPDAMRQGMIVPRNYLTIRAGRHAAFRNHKLQAVRALDDTIHSMIADGYLMEVQKDKVIEAYNYNGKAYRVLRLPDLSE